MNSSYHPTSHRLRAEERKLKRKMLSTAVFLILFFLFLIFIGVPFLIRLIAGFGLNRKSEIIKSESQKIIFPPSFDSYLEATNSAKIKLSGYAEKEQEVIVYVNDKQKSKVLADKDGRFSVSNLTLEEGENTITALSVREDRESSPSSPLIIFYKKEPPQLEIDSPKDGDKFLSEDKEIYLSGQTDPDVKLAVNDRLIIVDNDGKFKYKVRLSDGENKFKFKADDQAGNQTEKEIKVTYIP